MVVKVSEYFGSNFQLKNSLVALLSSSKVDQKAQGRCIDTVQKFHSDALFAPCLKKLASYSCIALEVSITHD